jgi:hypothetical protein
MKKCLSLLVALGIVLSLPIRARATVFISFGNHTIFQGSSVTLPIQIFSDANEAISSVDLYLQVRDGITTPAPYVSAIDVLGPGTTFGAVPSEAGSYGDPWDVYDGSESTGLKTAFFVFASPAADVPVNGTTLAYVTWTTPANTPVMEYWVSLTMDDLGPTLVATTAGPLTLGEDYFLIDGVLDFPEPSSLVLGFLAAAGLAAVGARRYRVRALRTCVPFLALAAVLCLPATAHAVITITFGNHSLNGGLQTFAVMISSDAGEEINAVDLYVQVEGGDADGMPYPKAVSIDMQGPGTVGSAVSTTQAWYGDPWDTTSDQAGDGAGSTGYQPAFAVFANATTGPNGDFPASGVLAYITWDSSGVPAGVYNVLLWSSDLGDSLVAKTSGPLELGTEYHLVPGSFSIPEPSSALLALLAAAALATVGVRRHRARRAAFNSR